MLQPIYLCLDLSLITILREEVSGFEAVGVAAGLQVPILDPQIHIQQGYAPYDQGIQQGIFIKDMTGQPYNGQASLYIPVFL